MSYAPCQNPNCKSYGKPHPNCRCYAEMAEGGDAGFCSSSRPHDPGCKYFADGGDTFDPDAYLAAKGGFDPDAYLAKQNAPAEGDSFDPDAYLAEKNQEQSGTTGQQVLAGVEGIAQGLAGPFATGAELGLSKLGVPGLSGEDIEARQEANPWTHRLAETGALVGSMFIGTGEAALIAKGAGMALKATKIAEMGKLGKLGANVLKGAITNGVIQLGDNASAWMIGQGDPQDPVGAFTAHMGANLLSSTLTGGMFGSLGNSARAAAATKSAEEIASLRLGDKLPSVLIGIGKRANPAEGEAFESLLKSKLPEPPAPHPLYPELPPSLPDIPAETPVIDRGAMKIGEKVHDYLLNSATTGVAGAAGAAAAPAIGYLGANVLAGILKPLLEKGFSKVSAKTVAPAMLKILNSGKFQGFSSAFNYADGVSRGLNAVDANISRLFGAAGIAAQQGIHEYGSQDAREKLREQIANGSLNEQLQDGINQQNQGTPPPGYAKGGEVKAPAEPEPPNGVAIHYPEQNVLLNATKGRISNYLNSLRPLPNQPKLPFDKEPDMRQQEKAYNKALDIANAPLGILDEIKKGTILPDHVKHLKSMYPELDNLLQKRLTQKITDSQLKDEKPPFHIRQGLSLYMGTALSAGLQPQSIQAAQAVFQQQQQGAPPQKKKSGSAPLTNSDRSFLTSSQSREGRQQRAH